MKKIVLLLAAILFNSFSFAQIKTEPTGNSTNVGVTEGQLSVSLTGGATYAIPITVAPGINGVVPHISLTYNSQGGNGQAGFGWNISGISSITRTSSTKFHDNNIDAVDFDNFDRFALDGQRLMLKSGTYGTNGAIYETENFSNVKITSYGINPNGLNYGPAYFIVQYPDGSKAYYGNNSNSRSITEYSIAYWENPQGVRISYSYTLSNNNLNIASIKYGSIGTNTAINEIQFIYNNRQRAEQSYVGGQSLIKNTFLKEIKVIGNGIGFKNYTLDYNDTSLGYNRLKSITEKSGDSSQSYNPTVFSYENTEDVLTFSPFVATIGVGNVSQLNSANISGDYDADGKMDFIIYPTTGPDAKKKFWLFNSSTDFFDPGDPALIGKFEELFSSTWLNSDNKLMPMQGITAVLKGASPIGIVKFNTYSLTNFGVRIQDSKAHQFSTLNLDYYYICPRDPQQPITKAPFDPFDPYAPIHIVEKKEIPKKYFNGDFNGDGLSDVIAVEQSFSYLYHLACSTITQNYTGGRVHFVDLDRRKPTNFVNQAGYINITANSKYIVADFNGDGKSDLFVFDTGKVKVYTLGVNNQLELLYQNTTTDSSINLGMPILMGDYNGDGKSDFIIPRGYGYNYSKYLSTGINFVKTDVTYSIRYVQSGGTDCPQVNTLIPSDMNGDGKTDLITFGTFGCFSGTGGQFFVRVYNNMGNDFINNSVCNTGNVPGVQAYPIPIFLPSNQPNLNLEIASISNNKVFRFECGKDSSKETILKSITLGNGITDAITYSSLESGSITGNENSEYLDSGYTEIYPNFDIIAAPTFKIVSKLERFSYFEYKKQNYKYYGAVSNTEGIGFLGFRGLLKTNWHNDDFPIITSISKNDISKRGAINENFTIVGETYGNFTNFTPSNFISKSNFTYNALLLSNKVFKINNATTIISNGLEGTSKQTAYTYDNYNSPLTVSNITKNGSNTEQTDTVTLEYYNQPTGTNYYIGRPKKKNSSVTYNGDTMTTEEAYVYNTVQLLSQVKRKGHLTNYLTEDNVYDTFGNVTKKTITAVGLTPRITNFTYDPSGRFLLTSKDIEGLTTTYTYNLSNGLLLTETLPSISGSLLKTIFEYDVWFKKKVVTDYLGKKNYTDYTILGTGSYVRNAGDDGSYSLEEFDDLGRLYRNSIKTIDDKFSTISTQYDIYNRKISVSEPYDFTQNTPSLFTTYSFDAFGRIINTVSPSGKITNTSYTSLNTTIDDGYKTVTTEKNSLGYVTKLTDNGGTINYQYFPNGNLKQSDFSGNVTSIEQDGWGRKTKLTEPSAGVYQYVYNEFGETTKETTPNGITEYTLNGIGKLTKKTIAGVLTNSETTYVYNGSTKLLDSSRYKDLIENNTTNYTYTYDSYKRLIKTVEDNLLTARFEHQSTFDDYGRSFKETYNAKNYLNNKISNKIVKNTYKGGCHWQIVDEVTNTVLWQTNAVNERGKLISANYGNGITATNTYDQYGFPTQFKYDKTTAPLGNVMTLTTIFEPLRGNLTSRHNNLFAWNENFVYDNLNRLTNYTNANGVLEEQKYNDNGSIKQNSLGQYNYNNPSVYQHSSVDLTSVANSYYSTRQDLNITYNTFKGPVEIIEETKEKLSFVYNMYNNRSAMYYGSLDNNKMIRPLRNYYSADGSMEIKNNLQSGEVEIITYIGGDAYSAPVVFKVNNTTEQYLYLHRDYQGTILAITNQAGNIVEKRLFDAWGSIIKVQDGSGTILTKLTLLDRGYTGHEHLQGVVLINMNGRLYDPMVHRFLQPDNNVQDPYNTQNYNRYGYVMNNPLFYTDPSGESWWSDNWKTVVVVAAVVVTAVVIVATLGTATPLVTAIWVGAGGGFVGGALGTALNGGSWQDCLLGGATGAVYGAAAGALGAYAATFAPIGAFGGAIYGGSTNVLIGGVINSVQDKPFLQGAAVGFVLGSVGGGVSGFQAAKSQGLNPMFGTPKPSVLANTINSETEVAQVAFDNSLKAQANVTSEMNTAAVIGKTKASADLPNTIKLEVKIHGNSLNSPKATWGYKLFSDDGKFLKTGITSRINPEARYTKAFMADKIMVPVRLFPNRYQAYFWEYQQNLIQRGPLNLNMH